MAVSEIFRKTVQEYLVARAKSDELFAKQYIKPNKSLDDCLIYILNKVRESGCEGLNDSEVFGMAIHYYQEDNIVVGQPLNCKVVVNHSIELSEEEQKEIREKALQRLTNEAYLSMKQKTSRTKKETTDKQLSLF